MKTLQIQTSPEVKAVFNRYPTTVLQKMETLRRLVMETAEEVPGITTVEETLKWGEPSYLVKKGSTIRMDWKEKNPNQYAIYFNVLVNWCPLLK